MFARCADLDDVNIASQRTASDNGDSVLLALVAAARHDRLAGRILVQRLLPGLVSASAKYRFLCEGADPAEHAVGGLWIAIRRYDHARRTRHVAASLISDTVFATFRRQTRLRSATEESVEPATFDDDASDPTTAPIAELAAVIRDAAQAGVPATDLELLRHLVRAGSPGVVARERSVTARTVRNHRNRAVARVRDALAA